ncbi:arylsulfatase [Rubritalea marina]|uniref:arylsulfatase n=1 Tax=Rubritalea marina TaxID=361055 RepID=UPI000379278E|nr:arylsulfatase [Rubritalea marina]
MKLKIALAQALAACALAAPLTTAAPLKGSKPNIIFILTDDQGMGDLACMGNPHLKTPHIDNLYAQSTRFTDYQVSPTCAPTRAAMMSGRHALEVGVSHTILLRERLSPEVVTFPQALQQAGYQTGLFGKWHLGDEPAYLPQNRGFHEVLMHGSGGIGQGQYGDFLENEENEYFDNVLLHNDTVVQTKGFCTDLFFDAALSWIHEQEQTDAPYFAYISLNAPHGPYIAREEDKQRFLDMGWDDKSAARYGMIENIDDNVGTLMQKLEQWKALEDTIVIFMTDNGMSMAPIKVAGQENDITPFNAGMRGRKNSAWEGGTHVPAFWYWKGTLPAGKDIHALTAHIDLYKTFCDLAGTEVPESKLAPAGRSLVPLLESADAEWPTRTLFTHRGRWNDKWHPQPREDHKYSHASVRSDKWRLVMYEHKGKVHQHLTDISQDPGESINLASQFPEVVASLHEQYNTWWDSLDPYLVNDNIPLPDPIPHPFQELAKEQKTAKGFPEWAPKALE